MIRVKNKNILAIDFGKSKVGVAIASTPIAEPFVVIRYKKEDEVLSKIKSIVQANNVSQVVIGISEGEMVKAIKEFGKKLEGKINVSVVYQDETLSTQDALLLSIKSGVKRKKRQKMEDAYAACLILQNYLDKQGT